MAILHFVQLVFQVAAFTVILVLAMLQFTYLGRLFVRRRSTGGNGRDNSTSARVELAHELERRMSGPQRHRLLHGFPLPGALPVIPPETEIQYPSFEERNAKGLLIGVLPHPFCNPRVPACGFCTLPHEAFQTVKASQVAEAVRREISSRINTDDRLNGRAVTGLYFGGGTANLTPPDDFRRLCRLLSASFDLTQAEVTLEGIPVMFLNRDGVLLNILEQDIPSQRVRLSMGIQTFDEERLKSMGRQSFGDATTFAEVVSAAQSRKWGTSADLLYNLPNQTRAEMQFDLQRAIDLGLDQICLYHLVLFRGLGTPWARDSRCLSGLPSNLEAVENWLTMRETLLQSGYTQTSLTNFERSDVQQSTRHYIYEECGYSLLDYQILGFGPGGISFSMNQDFSRGIKTVNPESSSEYLASVERGDRIWNRYFDYDIADLKVLSLTRTLAALRIPNEDYWLAFGKSVQRDFREELALLLKKGLVSQEGPDFVPTPKGMFYADSIAGVFAHRRLRELRSSNANALSELNSNERFHM